MEKEEDRKTGKDFNNGLAGRIRQLFDTGRDVDTFVEGLRQKRYSPEAKVIVFLYNSLNVLMGYTEALSADVKLLRNEMRQLKDK